MTTVSLSWVSDETESKEADFAGLIDMHAKITGAILGRPRTFRPAPYLYADLYAGPGPLSYNGRDFLGSPPLAWNALRKYDVPYEALFYERDPVVAAALQNYVPPDSARAKHAVYAEDCQIGFADWLATQRAQPWRYGLIYADPIHDEIPHHLLNAAAAKFERVDLLSYFSATQYKRRRKSDAALNGFTDKPFVSDHINAVNKAVALIRAPHGMWQFSFVVWTNWEDFPVWKKHGFYRVDSPEGQAVLDKLDLTSTEQMARFQGPLPW